MSVGGMREMMNSSSSFSSAPFCLDINNSIGSEPHEGVLDFQMLTGSNDSSWEAKGESCSENEDVRMMISFECEENENDSQRSESRRNTDTAPVPSGAVVLV